MHHNHRSEWQARPGSHLWEGVLPGGHEFRPLPGRPLPQQLPGKVQRHLQTDVNNLCMERDVCRCSAKHSRTCVVKAAFAGRQAARGYTCCGLVSMCTTFWLSKQHSCGAARLLFVRPPVATGLPTKLRQWRTTLQQILGSLSGATSLRQQGACPRR